MPLNEISILVPGVALHEHALSRIASTFQLLQIDHPSAAVVTKDMARSVRGIAAATCPLDATFIDALPRLEIISYFGMGYEIVDAVHATKCNVVVTNTPNVMNDEVADFAVGLLLCCVRELGKAEAWLRAGNWVSGDSYPLSPATLRGRTVGIFGMGRIGKAVAQRLKAFGLPIAYHNRSPRTDVPYTYHSTLLELARAVDTLICVAPGGPSTDKAIGSEVLRALGVEGVIINVGRGSTVDEEALASALSDGTIRAAGLDVFADEPTVLQRLLDAPNAVLVPHIASASRRTRSDVADLCFDNLVSWFRDGRALTPVEESLPLLTRTEKVDGKASHR